MRSSDQPSIIVTGDNMSEVTVAKVGIFSKINDLDFVEKEEKVSVTFPKEIIF